MPRSQGNIANSSGNVLEQTVISTFTAKGFEVVMYREWEKNPSRYGNELLLKNVPYQTIYGHSGNTEFLLQTQLKNMKIRIECKWQQSAGSVDEKFPYLYLNCIESMPENDVIIIIDGGGYKQGALDWIKKSIAQKKYQNDNTKKNIRIMSLVEFIKWANATF